MTAKKKTITTKVKKKKWYPIHASKNFNEQLLGESLLTDAERMKGKFVKTNLSLLTKSMRDQNINLLFKVNLVKDSKGYSSLINYNILPSFIKRFVRRDKSKIVDSFTSKDKSGELIRIKPLIITLNIATKMQQKELRRKTKEFTKDYVSKINYEVFVNELINKTFQKRLKAVLKKTLPVRFAEIRTTGYETLSGMNLINKLKVEETEKVIEEVPAEKTEEKIVIEKKVPKEEKAEEKIVIEKKVPAEVKEEPKPSEEKIIIEKKVSEEKKTEEVVEKKKEATEEVKEEPKPSEEKTE